MSALMWLTFHPGVEVVIVVGGYSAVLCLLGFVWGRW